MAKHFLISYKAGFMKGMHQRACDPNIAWCTKGRNKEQGTFKRKDVDCGNCERTIVYEAKENK